MASETKTYSVTIAHSNGITATAYVERPGAKYAVKIGELENFCSCPDAIFRNRQCKHIPLVVTELARIKREFETGFESGWDDPIDVGEAGIPLGPYRTGHIAGTEAYFAAALRSGPDFQEAQAAAWFAFLHAKRRAAKADKPQAEATKAA